MIQEAATQLLNGVPAETVKATLAEHFQGKRCSSLSNAISAVRTAVLASGVRPEGYEAAAAGLRAVAPPDLERDVHALLAASPTDQYRLVKAHASRPTWPDHVERALAQLPLLPPNAAALGLSSEENLSLKRERDGQRIRKNETLITVKDAKSLLDTVTAMLMTAKPTDSYSRLILPVLLVTGRRLVEVCDPTSTFGPTPNESYCTFDNQAKKRGQANVYTIPLLVPYGVLSTGLLALRQKQLATNTTTNTVTNTTNLTKLQVNQRFSGNLRRDLQKGTLPGFPRLTADPDKPTHPHDLRSAYMAFVYELYTSPYTFARTAMLCLGHETMQDSLVYNNVRLQGADGMRGSLGPLHI